MRDETSHKVGGIRDRLRSRVATALDDVINSGEYQKVTVLSHSLGTLISTDLMGDYHHSKCKTIRHITIGSPMEALTSRSSWLKDEIVECLENESISRWVDFYSSQDWLCTKIPRLPSSNLDKLTSHQINLKVPFFDQIVGASHQVYFFDKNVLEELLNG